MTPTEGRSPRLIIEVDESEQKVYFKHFSGREGEVRGYKLQITESDGRRLTVEFPPKEAMRP